MKRQPRVVWTRGMFLSPQHFQSQDQYFSDLIQFRLAASNFANITAISKGSEDSVFKSGHEPRCRALRDGGREAKVVASARFACRFGCGEMTLRAAS